MANPVLTLAQLLFFLSISSVVIMLLWGHGESQNNVYRDANVHRKGNLRSYNDALRSTLAPGRDGLQPKEKAMLAQEKADQKRVEQEAGLPHAEFGDSGKEVIFLSNMTEAELRKYRKLKWQQQQDRLLEERKQRAEESLPRVTADTFGAKTVKAGMDHTDRCLLSHKAHAECNTSRVLPLLVTGVGRSGTHHTWHSLRKKGIKVCHEAACLDGSVSWTYSVVDDRSSYPWENSLYRINGQRFATIVHQVRHPLRVIASLTTFEDISWRFIAKHTPAVPGLFNMHPLRKALIHWVTWNRMVEAQADFRVRMEDTQIEELCIRVGFPKTKCKRTVMRTHQDPRPHTNVTWDQLQRADPYFAQAAINLAHRYGYKDAIEYAIEGDDD